MVQEKTATSGRAGQGCRSSISGEYYAEGAAVYKRRQQRQRLAGEGCGSSISGEFYAEGAAVQEETATSATCWGRL